MRLQNFKKLGVLTLAMALMVATGKAAAEADLELATKPLINLNGAPNVLMAIDNSGSMNFELLFPTDSGMLYWYGDHWEGTLATVGEILGEVGTTVGAILGVERPLDGDVTGPQGFTTVDDGDLLYNTTSRAYEPIHGATQYETISTKLLVPYGYLFPNGCKSGGTVSAGRLYCQTSGEGLLPGVTGALGVVTGLLGLPLNVANPDIKLLPLLFGGNEKLSINAVPPIPGFGFVRSPDYNKIYFNPDVTYKPWPGYPNAAPTSAPWNPIVTNGQTADLTGLIEKGLETSEEFWRFRVDAGMTLPAGTTYTLGPLLGGEGILAGLLNVTTAVVSGVLDGVLDILYQGVLPLINGVLDLVSGITLGLVDINIHLERLGLLNQVVGLLGGWHTLDHDWHVGASPTAELLGLGSCTEPQILGNLVEITLLGIDLDWLISDILDAILGPLKAAFPSACDGAVNDLLKKALLPLDMGIKYYPATFYLKPKDAWNNLSDATFKTKCTTLFNQDQTVKIGYGPRSDSNGDGVIDGDYARQRLCGYEVEPGTAAMQNFANWFTYYRKRSLLAKGATAWAIYNSRYQVNTTGVIATNDSSDESVSLTKYSAYSNDDFAAQAITENKNKVPTSSIFRDIYKLPYTKPLPAPNRQALAFIGSQYVDLHASNTTSGGSNDNTACHVNYAMLVTDGFNTGTLTLSGGSDPDGDGHGNTIADFAMKYLDADPHMRTLAVTMGLPGRIWDPAKVPNNTPPAWETAPTFTPNLMRVKSGGISQIDDLWHAAVNSNGAMLIARDPNATAERLEAILDRLGDGTASAAKLAAGEDYIFQPLFTAPEWNGDLVAFKQSDNGVGTEEWRASETLSAMTPSDRLILTSVRSSCNTANRTAKAFTYNNLEQCTSLYATPDGKALTPDQVAYIRGDGSKENANGGKFRNRGQNDKRNILGDIVHSDPVVVAAKPKRLRYPQTWVDKLYPNATLPENAAPDYSHPPANPDDPNTSFAGTTRTPMVYVGANDGMLHGFNAENGEELLAYIPGVLLDDLAKLTQQNYQHRPYVDGSPVAGDVVFDDNEWHTVLVSGLRRGGQAVYALDVTDPSQFSAADDNPSDVVLWEFTDPELGYTYGKPSIVRLHNGKWAAVFGNGYKSGSGAELFIVDIETGALIAQIPTPASNKPNGIAGVAPADVDGDFIVDYVYAGDLQGNLWKFDLTAQTPGGTPESPTNWTASKLLKAKIGDTSQPITAAPVIGAHPYGSSYGVMVYFGTGRLLTEDDKSSTQVNSFYGIWDPNVIGSTIDSKPATAKRDTDLVEQDIFTTKGVSGETYRAITDLPVHYNGAEADQGNRGWYVDLVNSDGSRNGERVISAPYIRNNVVGFSTAISVLGAEAACTPGGGFIMRLSTLNGGPTIDPSFDANGDGHLSKDDAIFEVDAETGTGTTAEGDATKKVGAAGVRVNSGRPSAATFVPGKDYVLYNTTSGTIRSARTPEHEDVRRTWRIIRP